MTEDTRRKLSLKNDTAASDTPRLQERLHKVLAQAGLGSRRALEQRIADGLVKVNGEVAQVGLSIGSGDKVELDGRQFVASALNEPSRVLMYNKPEGEVTTREDPEGRPTIFDALPALKGARWIAVGRLDINTTGLLMLTTDGELANTLMHPSHEVSREYVCRVRAPEGQDRVEDPIVERLKRGVTLEDGPAKFDDVERIGGADSHDWFRVVVKEGRNREVRRLWESQGCQVSRLKRIKYGSVDLPRELLRGQSQELITGAGGRRAVRVDAAAGDRPAQGGALDHQPGRSCAEPGLCWWSCHQRRRGPRTATLRQRARGPRSRPWRAQAPRWPDGQRRSRRQPGAASLQTTCAERPAAAARRQSGRFPQLVCT